MAINLLSGLKIINCFFMDIEYEATFTKIKKTKLKNNEMENPFEI